ncbi:MAG: C40 family peptidase [Streptomyces sp.]|uniref:C40 family peptidase n=1 Tax=Streptomyces sp. TaxID=1931 RepID=UPI003D6A32C8
MSPNAHIARHRKPRAAKIDKALRAGLTGGVMGTIALTTAVSPASASETKNTSVEAADTAKTAETAAVSGSVTGSTAQAADSLKTTALKYELREAQAKAAGDAREQARKTKEKAEAAAERKAEAAREKAAKAAERASRSSDRTALSTGGGNVAGMISFLKAQVGKSYVMGASGPNAYDCSSLTQAAFKQIGVSLPRTSQPQSTAGTSVSLDSLQKGDLLYWGSAGSAYHVGVYIGDGKYIGAQNPETGVAEKTLDWDPPTGAVRVQ